MLECVELCWVMSRLSTRCLMCATRSVVGFCFPLHANGASLFYFRRLPRRHTHCAGCWAHVHHNKNINLSTSTTLNTPTCHTPHPPLGTNLNTHQQDMLLSWWYDPLTVPTELELSDNNTASGVTLPSLTVLPGETLKVCVQQSGGNRRETGGDVREMMCPFALVVHRLQVVGL